MIKIVKTLLALLMTSIWACLPAQAAESPQVDTGKVVAQLVSSHHSAPAGSTVNVALRTVLDDKWHTYWRNPGDSGEPVQIDWRLPEGASAGEITWPLPDAIPTGPLINYGFEGVPFFPVPITLPEHAQSGEMIIIEAGVYYLVCKDLCIPESADLSLQIMIGDAELNGRWDSAINRALDKAPKKGTVEAGVMKVGETVIYSFANLPKGDFSRAHFFPNDLGVIKPSEAQKITITETGLKISVGAEYVWNNALPKSFEGVLRYMDNGEAKGVIVSAAVGQAMAIGAPVTVNPSNGGASTAPTNRAIGGITLWGAVIGAFLGGLILNLMPCVFPIISLKALSLTKIAHGERSAIRRSAWGYTAGVSVSFAVFAGLILILKAAGTSVGWGFQLQSPWLVGLLSLLLFAIGLNLLGMFELNGRFQNIGSDTVSRSGPFSNFLTGVLAVIVATPCTAPFMAGAVGFALAGSTLTTVGVFLALGLGFALPFLLVAYIPGLLARLPKPGPWMETFKQFLAFPMFAAAIWLAWVLTLQSGADAILRLLGAGLLLTLGLWSLKQKRSGFKVFGVISIMGAILFLITSLLGLQSSASSSNATADLKTNAWSAEAVAIARAEGRPVFVDFTAAWCVTCKVNEITVLKTKRTAELFERTDTEFLVADWTRKDDVIAAELARFGRAGVPLYLVYRPGEETAEVLPQILTYDILKTALE